MLGSNVGATFRYPYFALLATALMPVHPAAGEQKGVLRSIDRARSRVAVESDGRTETIDVARDASLIRQDLSEKKKSATIRIIEDGLAGIAVGSKVEYLTEDVGGRRQITSLKVTSSPQAATASTSKASPTKPKPKPKPKAKPKANSKTPPTDKNKAKPKGATSANAAKKP